MLDSHWALAVRDPELGRQSRLTAHNNHDNSNGGRSVGLDRDVNRYAGHKTAVDLNLSPFRRPNLGHCAVTFSFRYAAEKTACSESVFSESAA